MRPAEIQYKLHPPGSTRSALGHDPRTTPVEEVWAGKAVVEQASTLEMLLRGLLAPFRSGKVIRITSISPTSCLRPSILPLLPLASETLLICLLF